MTVFVAVVIVVVVVGIDITATNMNGDSMINMTMDIETISIHFFLHWQHL